MSVEKVELPDGYRYESLKYDPAANVLVLEARSMALGAHFVPTRLFVRRSEQDGYEPVVDWDDATLSTSCIVFAGDGRLAAFNSERYTSIEEGRVGGDWHGTFLWDIGSSEVKCCVDESSLNLPDGFTRGWITKLMAFSQDRSTLFVEVGLQNAPTNFKVEYYLAALDLISKRVRTITVLRNCFY